MVGEQKKGKLEKLKIIAYEKQNDLESKSGVFTVPFNPEEYTWSYDVKYSKEQGQGTTGSPMVYRGIKPQQYKLKFLIDGTGVTGEAKIGDVKGKERKEELIKYVLNKIEEFKSIIGYDGDKHRPNYLKICWGETVFSCVLIKYDITYKLFNHDGRPLRAIINATFLESIDDETRVKKAKDKSPDLTHKRKVKEGDELPLLAYKIYGDVSYYLEVARINKLNHFRHLKPGKDLIFPPIDKKGSYE